MKLEIPKNTCLTLKKLTQLAMPIPLIVQVYTLKVIIYVEKLQRGNHLVRGEGQMKKPMQARVKY